MPKCFCKFTTNWFLECSNKNKDFVEKKLKTAMESVAKSEYHMFTIPLDVNVNSGNNWDEAH